MRTTPAFLLAAAIAFAAAGSAHAWEFRDLVTPLGDTGTGIFQEDADGIGATFAFGCDRDRWRMAVLLPTRGGALRLSRSGKVRFSFDGEPGPEGRWRVDRIEKDRRTYEIPRPTDFVARMIREEEKDPAAKLRIEVRDHRGETRRLVFPLRGLRRAIRSHLWEPCKLGVYFGEPKRP